MAEDLLEELAPLPVLPLVTSSAEVKRGEVFCSKIIHQKATHQARFTRSAMHLKMDCVSTDETGRQFTRPLSSPFPCWQCHRKFTGPPIFIPMVVLSGTRTEWGNFCTPPCANTYLHKNMNDSNLAARVADFFEYCQDVHGFKGEAIGFAPHFSLLETYGGCMDNTQFDTVSKTPGLRTHERMAPFIPTEVVVEWQCRVNDADKPAAAQPHTASVFARNRTAHTAAVPTKTASEELATVMGSTPEAAHHHQWEVRGLSQPKQETIERRLLSLPRPEQKEGLYDLYWKRHGSGVAVPESGNPSLESQPKPEEAMPPPPLPAATKPKRPRPVPKADPKQGAGLGSLLVPTKRPRT